MVVSTQSSAIRNLYSMGSVDSSTISLVGDSATCALGVSSLNAVEVAIDSLIPIATEVFVYALGSRFYVVDRGNKSTGSRARDVLLFTSTWTYVGRLGVSAYPVDP
jgi:hypothetical protein